MNSTADNSTEQENLPSVTRRPSYSQGVFLTGTGTTVNIALLFLETMVAALLLDTDALGLFVLLTVAVDFLVMVVGFGCQTAVTRLIASSDRVRQEAIANSTLVFRAVLLAVTSLIVYLARDALLLLDPSGVVLKYLPTSRPCWLSPALTSYSRRPARVSIATLESKFG